MKNKISKILRYIFTLTIIFMSYYETGHWTAAALFLIFFAIEINTELYEIIMKNINEINKLDREFLLKLLKKC